MYKLYSHTPEKFKALTDKSEVISKFELIEATDVPAEEVLNHRYDVIEFEMNDYEKYRSHIKAVDWKTNLTEIADCLILKDNNYRPYSLLPDAIVQILKRNPSRTNSLKPVIVIGDLSFMMAVVTKLALSGFIEIIVSLTDDNQEMLKVFEKKIRSFVFNLNLRAVPINELTSSELEAYLLISNFQKEKNSEAYELLSYFNYLSEKAIFIDCNSIKDGYLVDDARKTDIFVVDELEVLENKYIKLLESLKISP